MCGIFGWNLKEGSLSNSRRKILYDLLVAQNDSRGGHSWGICAVDRQTNTPAIEKGLGDMFSAIYAGLLPWKSDTMFGHTRFATHGAKITDNAHPFKQGSVIGAHNGVLSNHFQLNRENSRDFAVDSQHIFAHIDEGKPLSDLEGYGAIEYIHESEPHKVLIGTFNHYVAVYRLKDKTGVIWSSDLRHAEFAIKLLRLDAEKVFIKDHSLYSIHDNDIWETDALLPVRRASTKWDWRDGEFGGSATGTEKKYQSRTVTTYRSSDFTKPASEAPKSGEKKESENDSSGSPNNNSNNKRRDHAGRSVIGSGVVRYCKECRAVYNDKFETCKCEREPSDPRSFIDCPGCNGQCFSQVAGGAWIKCSVCRGQGMIEEPDIDEVDELEEMMRERNGGLLD